MSITAVVLAGGSGSRLWPMSRAMYPKQFLSLAGENSLLQDTLSRLSSLDLGDTITICNEEHRFFVAEQLKKIGHLGRIILEPQGRNTAPAITLAALNSEEDSVLLVMAADHKIDNESAFITAVENAVPLAKKGRLVTFGIEPTQAHTGYGYIKRGEIREKGYCVEKFVEKPSAALADQYIQSGDYYWNSGIFMFTAGRYLEELKKYRPDILTSCIDAMKEAHRDMDFLRLESKAFLSCAAESVDYAVMEKTDDAIVIPVDAGWSDIGSWSSLWEISKKDNDGNVIEGDVLALNSKDSYIRSDGRLLATVGVENLVVIETKDAVLIANKDRVQDTKLVVEKLREESRPEWEIHREVYRPWGKYDSVDEGHRYQVKRITVKPGAKLSVQMHHHRAEHWIVVSGTAKVTCGEETFLLSENESTFIPIGVVHALENPGKVELELIEVQSGTYLGEDDIVRFDDLYGRAGA